MMSVAIRFARAVNRGLGRTGRVLEDRYHVRVLATPRQVRNAIRYVLLNARRHAAKLRRSRKLRGPMRAGPVRLDLASSARWFEGWRRGIAREEVPARFRLGSTPAVSRPRTWLLRDGLAAARGAARSIGRARAGVGTQNRRTAEARGELAALRAHLRRLALARFAP